MTLHMTCDSNGKTVDFEEWNTKNALLIKTWKIAFYVINSCSKNLYLTSISSQQAWYIFWQVITHAKRTDNMHKLFMIEPSSAVQGIKFLQNFTINNHIVPS